MPTHYRRAINLSFPSIRDIACADSALGARQSRNLIRKRLPLRGLCPPFVSGPKTRSHEHSRMQITRTHICFWERGTSMSRKVGQIIARGDRGWLVRIYLGRDHETHRRTYHNRTVYGSLRHAQAYLT